jgi:tetratricopeptide (TPR) repeat protein
VEKDSLSSESSFSEPQRQSPSASDRKVRKTESQHLSWEVEWRKPVMKKLFALAKCDPKLLKKVLKAIRLLGEGRTDEFLKIPEYKNGVHIRAALVREVKLLWEKAIAFSSRTNTAPCPQTIKESKAPRLYSQKIRIWDLSRGEKERDTAVEEICHAIEEGKQCNPRLIVQVKQCHINQQSAVFQEGISPGSKIPKLYAVTKQQDCKKDCKEVCLPRSVNEDDCTTEKFYEFTSDVANRIQDTDKEECDASWFPFVVTHQEHEVIRAESDRPILVHGRSGTGKTTCLIYRLWERYRRATTPDSRRRRQIFVSKNPVFVKKVEKYFEGLLKGSNLLREQSKRRGPLSLKEISSNEFPLFLTAREYFAMLELSIAPHKTVGESEQSPGSKMPQLYDEEMDKTLATSDLQAQWHCEDWDWYRDQAYDTEINFPELAADLEMDSGTWSADGEVSYLTFQRDMWSHLVKDLTKSKDLHPVLVWKEIKSFIKGTFEALSTEDGYLTQDQYASEIGRKQAPDFTGDQRKEVYKIAQQYKLLLKKNESGYFDECDRVRLLYSSLFKPGQGLTKIIGSVDEIYVDEIQDFTQAEIAVITLSCRKPQNMFLTGDTAQAITKGISFRFQDLQQLFRKLPVFVRSLTKPYELTENYRSHMGILNLAASVIEILRQHFPYSYDHELPRDEGRFAGPKPVFLESCTPTQMAEVLLPGWGKKDRYVEFGAYQAIIVRSGKARSELPLELRQGVCLTIFEAKGLEFQDVLLYNFFKDSEGSDRDWQFVSQLVDDPCLGSKNQDALFSKYEKRGVNPRILCSELKQFYTAITRARRKVWVYDEVTKKRDSITKHFLDKSLIDEVKNPSDSLEVIIGQSFAESSEEHVWEKRGKEFEEEKRWDLAANCYERAGAHSQAMFCKAHSTVISWLRRHDRVNTKDLLEAARIFLSQEKQELAAKVHWLAGDFIKAAEIMDDIDKGEEAIALYKKAHISTLTHDHLHSRARDCLLRCCKKYNDWKLLIAVLREERKYEEAIEELNHYNKITAESPEKILSFKSVPSVTVQELAYEAATLACDHIASDGQGTNRVIYFVSLLSGQSLHQFIQFLEQSGKFTAFGLLQEAGKLSLVDTAKLYYRFGKLEEAISASADFKEWADREFRAHCRSTLFWERLKNILPSKPSQTDLQVTKTLETNSECQELFRHLEAFALECHDEESDGEIDAKFLLYLLSGNSDFLLNAYHLSVKHSNIMGQVLSLHRLFSKKSLKVVDTIFVLRTVQIVQDFCTKLISDTSSKLQKAALMKLCERELRYLGVHFDSQCGAEETPSLWFPTATGAIHLWELPGSSHLKSKLEKAEGFVECNKLLTVVGGALLHFACNFILGERDFTNTKSGQSANGVVGELEHLVPRAWCPEHTVGIKCKHESHEQVLPRKQYVATLVMEAAKTLDCLITTIKKWPTEDKRPVLVKGRLNELEESRTCCLRNVIDLCMPSFHCKLAGSDNKAMIRWARHLDQQTMRCLGNCIIHQWKRTSSSVDLFNVWRMHKLAGSNSQTPFENWFHQAQYDYLRKGPKKEKHGEWLQREISRSLVEYKGKIEHSHGFAFWLWLEFLVDTYQGKDLTSGFRALCYLVSFELKPALEVSIQKQKMDNILMLMEIGVSLALLVMSKKGRPVAIPSPFVAGYMVLDAALSSNKKQGQLHMEYAVKEISWDQDMEDWARRFLLLSAEHVGMSVASSELQVATSATEVRGLVLVLTLLCNSDKQSELRKRCSAILSGKMKNLLLQNAPFSKTLAHEPNSALEGLPCLNEILSSYNPKQWIYIVDWKSRFLTHQLEMKNIEAYSREIEECATQRLTASYIEYVPELKHFKGMSFPYIISQNLPQLWTIHGPDVRPGSEKRIENNPVRTDRYGTCTGNIELPPSLRIPKHGERSCSPRYSVSQGINTPKTVTSMGTMEQLVEQVSQENVHSLHSEHELDLEIDGKAAHFTKWLEEPAHNIDPLGGEIVSSKTENHVVFPPGAVHEDVQITYSQFCLDRLWEGDKCILDLVQLLPHDIRFHKKVKIYTKHHLKLDKSCEIQVMKSTVKTNNQRQWSTIAVLHHNNLGETIPTEADNCFVRLEDNFIVISSMHFCELCFVIKGLLQLAVQFYQLLPKPPRPNVDKFHLYLFLSCRSVNRMKSVSNHFPSDCTPIKKGHRFVEVQTETRKALIIQPTFLTDGWKLMGKATDTIRVEYRNLENHTQNEHEPQVWDLYYKRTSEEFDPSNKVEIQLCFSSEGVEDITAWVFGSEQSSSTQAPNDPPEESDADRQLKSADIRTFYLSVCHKWKSIARMLPSHEGTTMGLKDFEIVKIEAEEESNEDRCYEALSLWTRNCPESATMVAIVRILLNPNLGLSEVVTTNAVFQAAFEKCRAELPESNQS